MSAFNFGLMFRESKGAPVAHNGKTLIMFDRFPARLGDTFVVTIESTNAEWPQGIGIAEGVEVFGRIPFVLQHDRIPGS